LLISFHPPILQKSSRVKRKTARCWISSFKGKFYLQINGFSGPKFASVANVAESQPTRLAAVG
jgi:hypothetical protein